jgi:hypothetical protein
MCDCKLLKKEHLGSGNFNWTFKCKRSNKSVTVTSGNENEARQLAELECDSKENK